MDFDLGNVQAANVIQGATAGLENAAKSMYAIRQAKRTMDMKQQELDNETDYKHAQIDYLEGRGQLAGSQADAYRFNIKEAEKKNQRFLDVNADQIDAAHQQVMAQGSQYRNILNAAIQSPQGQDYVADQMSGANEATGQQGPDQQQTPQDKTQGSPVVNSIMPGVGANSKVAQSNFVPVTNGGNMRAITGREQADIKAKRNTSLQRAFGKINDMEIDSREDAEHYLNKYYGADWSTNQEAKDYLDQKYGKGAAPQQQTPQDKTNPQGAGGAGGAGQSQDQSEMVNVTSPDGTPYKLPRANLQKALKRGYRVR